MPPLEIVPENIKVVERGKYEDVKAGEPVRPRHTSVVSSGPSVLRSTLHEAPKAQLSPGIYDDTSARRTPVSYQNTMSRGSPMMNRTSDGMLLLYPCLIDLHCLGSVAKTFMIFSLFTCSVIHLEFFWLNFFN